MTRRSSALPLLATLFLLSGFSAVLYQVIWQRILGILSGVHIYSITVIVTAFMAGLGFGSLVGGRFADRMTRRRSLLAFAICELLIGLFALASPTVYYDFAYVRLSPLLQNEAALPFVHFLLLLVPTFLMGASLPFLARGLVVGTDNAAKTIGLLYSLNAVGAGLGAMVSIWLLIGNIGFAGTIRVGAILNLIASVGAWWVSQRTPAEEAAESPPPSPRPKPEAPSAGGAATPWVRWAWLYGLSGFIALSLEILWFRYLDVAIKASPYTFGHILGLFLLLLGIGSVIGTMTVGKSRNPARTFLVGQWAISLTAGAGVLVLSQGPVEAGWLQPLVLHWFKPSSPEIARVIEAFQNSAVPSAADTRAFFLRLYFGLPLWLIGAPVLLMGFTYAYVQKAVQTSLGDVGWRTGVVQAMNILGSMLGSFVTGAILLGVLGTPRSFQLLGTVGILVFGVLAARQFEGHLRRIALTIAIVSLLVPLGLPAPGEFWARLHGMHTDAVVAAEDATGVAALQFEIPGMDWVPMRVNGKMHSRVPFGDEHTLLGMIPSLLHPKMETALLIGMGTGNTAWAAAVQEHTREVRVFEIVRPEFDVLETMAQRQGPYDCVRQLLEDPRIDIRFTDGRLALRTTEETFDMVEADGLDPSMAYSGNLYSREFFELCRSRLAPGGILCTYVPTERTRRTVVDVFPYVLDFHAIPDFASFIIASDSPLHFDRDEIRRRFEQPWTQQYLERSGLRGPTRELFERFMELVEVTVIDERNRDEYRRGDINTDLFPRDEFDATYVGDYQ